MKVRISRCKKCLHFRDMGGNALHQCNAFHRTCCEDVDYRQCKYDPKHQSVKSVKSVVENFCLAVAVSLFCGCANIVNHVDDRYNLRPYCGTVDDVDVIATAFRSPRGPEGTQAKAFAIILLPLSIIDLPLEVVADTVTLPYDLYKHSKD